MEKVDIATSRKKTKKERVPAPKRLVLHNKQMPQTNPASCNEYLKDFDLAERRYRQWQRQCSKKCQRRPVRCPPSEGRRDIVSKIQVQKSFTFPPGVRWHLFSFSDHDTGHVVHIHDQSYYVIGRDENICHIQTGNESCSKVHAVLQYRNVPADGEDTSGPVTVIPFITDLQSLHGTFVNGDRIEAGKLVELHDKDVITFAFSKRVYILIRGNDVQSAATVTDTAHSTAEDPINLPDGDTNQQN